KHPVPHEFKELREHGLNIGRTHDHLIRDAGQIRDLKGDRAFRVHECAEPVHDLPVHHLDSADLNDPVPDGTESCGLNIKHYICIVKRLFPRIDSDLRQVIHHVAFHTVNNLE